MGAKDLAYAQAAPPEGELTVVPKLADTPLSEKAELFRRKLHDCSIIFDFRSNVNPQGKESKRRILLEIVEHVSNSRNCFNESLMQDVVNMVGQNIFRALQTKKKDPSVFSDTAEDDEPCLDRAWPHLWIVYEFFLRFVVSNDVDPKLAKRFVDQNFLLKLLELFDSEDPRERDYLKAILYRIYGKFMSLRSFIRRAVQHVLFKVIYEGESHDGVGELLEILGSIIDGFALPLKEEHKDFLTKALIPLHKVKFLVSCHQQLSHCMVLYVVKEPRLAHDIIVSMLQCWPISSTSKQVVFLGEVEEILKLVQPHEVREVRERLFSRIAKCLTCPHFQVALRALELWKNDFIVKQHINQSRAVLFPIIIRALNKNFKHHWNSDVNDLTSKVFKLLRERDPQLYETCVAEQILEDEEEDRRIKERQDKWNLLQTLFDKSGR